VRLAEAKRAPRSSAASCKILLDDGPQRIEDVKTCDLVGMLDGVIREYKPRPCSPTASPTSTTTTC
jgi:hypothetical protein